MSDILNKILDHKKTEVEALLKASPIEHLRELAEAAPPAPSFYDALHTPGGPHLIAEVKKASPSKGVIRADFDPVQIAIQYERGGAAALSVLTDREFFQGNLAFIPRIRQCVKLPILRKDFIIDEAQIFEARAAGASAILLIAAALDPYQMADLHRTADSIDLDVLVEIHDEDDLKRVVDGGCPARILGVNNRNLRTFEVDLAVTERLFAKLKGQYVLVSESGIFTPDDVARVAAAGANAILVGESLMRQPDPEAAVRALLSPASGVSE